MNKLKPFDWPAESARAHDPRLDQVCVYAEALEARLEALERDSGNTDYERGWREFAPTCRAKMAAKHEQGVRGFENLESCPPGRLQKKLIDHLAKGDPVDVANFAMMIWYRGESVCAPANEERVHETARSMAKVIHNMVVGQQSAWIEWRRGRGAEAAMTWVHNGLAGPGHLPPEDAPYSEQPQAWYDANQADPFPYCTICSHPSHQLWCGHGACSNEHMRQIQSLNSESHG